MSINYYAATNHTGYGIASLNILKEISKITSVSYFPIGSPSVSNQSDFEYLSQLIKSTNESFNPQAPCVKIWHQFDLANRIGTGKYVAYPFFELDTFNHTEKLHLQTPDLLIASSQWGLQIYQNNNINKPMSVVPLGVDTRVFNHSIPRTRTDNNYVFLTVGKWEVRKGHDILPEIFNKAFPSENDVELWILAAEHTNGYSKPEEIKAWKKLYNYPRIKIIPGLAHHSDIAQLMANSDCGLYVSRAEGWNLELLETMAMNKPAIATNYAAHTEFCNDKNSYLIDIDQTENAYDGKAFVNQGRWAKIGKNQIDQAIEYMRYVYKNRINSNIEGVNTANKFSWKNSAECLYRCITN
jgi:glycosyltransferase involved in cell wall biosynthesis